MAKTRPAPIVHTERLLALVPFISAHQGISINELAKAFNVTTSQMSADLTTLWMCGLPGYTALELMDLSFESGFVTIRNAPTLKSARALSTEEVISLLLGLDIVRESLPDNYDIAASIEKLSQRLSEKVGLTATFRASDPVSGTIRAEIEQGLAERKLLEISYHSLYTDRVTQRRIVPLELRIEDGIEYLFAYCHSASAFRVFRLDRIQTLRVSSEDAAHIPLEVPNQKSELNAQITINSRARLMKERFDLDDAPLDVALQIHSFSRQWIIRSVFASSASARLLEPSDLGLEIAEKAQLILDRYQAH
jgi:proteasome accessory factor C